MKTKLMIFILALLIIQVGTITAMNTKSYDLNSKTVTIRDNSNNVLATVQLLTPQVNFVEAGNNRIIAELQITSNVNTSSIFESMDFYDLKSSFKKISKSYELKYTTSDIISVNDFIQVCNNINFGNGTTIQNCSFVSNGSHYEVATTWNKLTPAILKKNDNLKIGISMDLNGGEYIEWIPTMFGLTINEFASVYALKMYENATFSGGVTNAWGGHILDQPFRVGGMRANEDFNLSLIKVYVSGSSGIINVSVIGADSAGNAVTSTTYDTTTVNVNGVVAWYNATFKNTTVLQKGNNYTIRVSGIAGTGNWNLVSGSIYSPFPFNFNDGGKQSGYAFGFEVWGLNLTSINASIVSLNSPVNNYNTSSNSVTLNCSGVDLDAILSLKLKIDGNVNVTVTNSSAGLKSLSIEQTVNLDEGVHTWTCDAVNVYSFNSSTSPRTLTIDQTPPYVALTSPNMTYEYKLLNDYLYLNWTLTELSPSACWYQYNNVNTSVACSSNTATFNLTSSKSLKFYVTDGIGNIGYNVTSWDYKILQNGESHNSNVLEGTIETFTLNITTSSPLSVAKLNFNNTDYYATIMTNGENYYITRSIMIPSVSANSTVTSYWNLQLSNGDSINSSSFSVNIANILIDNCATYNNIIYNFTLKDEESQELINGSMDNSTINIDLRMYSSDLSVNILNFSRSYRNITYAPICINYNLSTTDKGYKVDALIQYSSIDRSKETYNIQKQALTNSTIPKLITFYDLAIVSAEQFKIIFKDNNFLPVENALIDIKRRYVSEGTSKTTEIPKTDRSGIALAWLDLNSVFYDVEVSKDGTILAYYSDIAPLCESGLCILNLQQSSEYNLFNDYINFEDLSYSLSFDDNARTISLDFINIKSQTNTVQLKVTKYDSYLNNTICYNNITSSSGTILCTVPQSLGNISVIYEVFKDGVLVTEGTVSYNAEPKDFYGNSRLLFVIIIFVMFSLMAVNGDMRLVLVFGVLGVLVTIFFALIESSHLIGTASFVISLILGAGILIYKLNNQDGY